MKEVGLCAPHCHQPLDGITASGTQMLALKQRLLHEFGLGPTAVASFGSDETRYHAPARPGTPRHAPARPGTPRHAPARPGDVVYLRFSWLEKRESRSRPEWGIARHFSELVRDDGVTLLSIQEIILIRRRPARLNAGEQGPE